MTTIDEILDFWFATNPADPEYQHNSALWFHGGQDVDKNIRDRFEASVESAFRGDLDEFKSSPRGCLALVILLDQFPRNMHRGSAKMFAYDAASLRVAEDMIEKGWDRELSPAERMFVYLPLQHTETVETVDRSTQLLANLVETCPPAQKKAFLNYYRNGQNHLELIRKFGRYPHRNQLLGRETTPEEAEVLRSKSYRFMRSVLPPAEKEEVWKAQLASKKAPSSAPRAQPSSTEAPARPKKTLPSTPSARLRILVLHSFRQNAQILRQRTAKLRKMLSEFADLYYMSAPHPYEAKGEVREALLDSLGTLPETQHQRIWFHSTEGNAKYEGLEESVEAIGQVWKKEGPFDGVIGFSQGGCVAGVLAALQHHSHPMLSPAIRLRFVVCISGFVPRAEDLRTMFYTPPVTAAAAAEGDSSAENGLIDLPSLHIWGTQDALVDPARSTALSKSFVSPQVFTHGFGHFVPDKWPLSDIQSFLSPFATESNGSQSSARVQLSLSHFLHPIGDHPTFTSSDFGSRLQRVISGGDTHVLSEHTISALLEDEEEWLGLWESGLRIIDCVADECVGELRNTCERLVRKVLTSVAAKHGQDARQATAQDLILLSCVLPFGPTLRPRKNKAQHFTSLFSFLFIEVFKEMPSVALPLLKLVVPDARPWRDLSKIAVLASQDRLLYGEHGEDVVVELDSLHRAVCDMFTEQLVKDSQALTAENAGAVSQCSVDAPRTGSQADRLCHLGRDIALAIHAVTGKPQPVTQDQRTACYIQYLKLLQKLKKVAVKGEDAGRIPAHWGPILTTPGAAVVDRGALRVSSKSKKQWDLKLTEPLPDPVLHPAPAPVTPCTLPELQPLLDFLKTNEPVDAIRAFSKGTMVPDGRLDLCKQVVGPKGISPLLDAMRSNTQVSRLLLGNNVVGNEGAFAIADFIKTGSHLTTWYIAGNDIKAEGMEAIADALAHDTRVEALWLKRNPLLPSGMIPMARLLRTNTHIRTLDLVNTGVLDEGCVTLCEALAVNKTLEHLYLGINGISSVGADHIGRYLSTNQTLLSLYLSCNRLGDSGAQHLARGLTTNTRLERLSLASNRITAEGAKAISEAVQNHPNLVFLDLGFIRATTDVGELGNRIGDEGAAHIADLIRTNTTLRSLSVMHNAISQTGLAKIRDALLTNTSIITLQHTQYGMVHNEVTKEQIAEQLQRNREVCKGGPEEWRKIDVPEFISEIYSVYRTHM